MKKTFWILCLPWILQAYDARVVSVNGVVTADAKNIAPGQVLKDGQTIETQENSGAKLLFTDKTLLDIGPKSKIKLGNQKELQEIELDFGQVKTSIEKKTPLKERFRVRTKTSVLSARGTVFVVEMDHGKAGQNFKTTVGEGNVEVRGVQQDKTFTLRAGNQASWKVGLNSNAFPALQPKVLDTKELGNVFTKAQVVDKTFNQSVNVQGQSSQGAKATLSLAFQTGIGRNPASQEQGKAEVFQKEVLNPADRVRDGTYGTSQIANTPVTVIFVPN